jgi:hypothetical protein
VRVFRSKVFLVILFSVYVVSSSNAENIIYVDVNAPNDPGTGSYEDPFRRIQDAIDAAEGGDTIEIQPGLYTGEGNYDLDPNGLAVTIRSTDPNNPEVVAATIIDPNKAGRGFYIHSYEDANCIVAGLTIKNGYTVIGPYGGGLYCYDSSPTIRNCVIKDGYATDTGGGVFCNYDNPRIIDCIITGNSAEFYGGGIGCFLSDPEIIGCVIKDNTAGEEGGGFDLVLSMPTIVNSVIADNEATIGGGINCYSLSEASLANCTVARNCASDFGGALCCRDESDRKQHSLGQQGNSGPADILTGKQWRVRQVLRCAGWAVGSL